MLLIIRKGDCRLWILGKMTLTRFKRGVVTCMENRYIKEVVGLK